MKIIHYIILFSIIVIYMACGVQKNATGEFKTTPGEQTKDSKRSAKVTSLFIDANKEKILGNFRQAITLYQECLELDPHHDPSMYEMARLYNMQGAVNEALALAEKAAEINPENKWYNLLLASLYEQTGQNRKAIEIFEKLQALYPKDIEYLYQTAMLYMKENRFGDAVAIYDKIERIIGPAEEIIIQKHKLHLMNGQSDKAVAEIEKLIKNFPDESRYYALLAELYLDLENYPKAIESLQRIRELDPQNPYIQITLAEYYFKIGEKEKAYQELIEGFAKTSLDIEIKLQVLFSYFSDEELEGENYDLALKLASILASAHPTDVRPYSLQADLLVRKEKFSEASEALREALKIDNSKYFMWETLLRLNAALSDTTAMRNDGLSAIELFPLQPLPYLFTGLAYFMLQDLQEAISKFDNGKDLVVDDDELLAEFYTHLGDAYNKSKQFEESDSAFEQALKLNPENPYVLNNYSYYLSLRKIKLEDAEKMSAKSLELDPENKHYLDTYGWIMFQMGKYEEAKKWIEKSIANSASEDATVLEHLGDILYKLGNIEEAIGYWKRALDFGGETTELLQRKVKDGELYE